MGVPKFYRWISERYPCLSEVVKEFQLPEFDNLYLDMNGIIHVCSHPDDDNPHFRIKEEDIFKNICHYIDFLYRMIKPRKVFFMAVDGVAPRAKMNQQRGRRFRSAREAEQSIQKAQERGEVLPTEQRFDSNCITPGTPFMVRLQTHLKYFVVDKITNDPLWQGRRIYLSGHETPGEGEHKVMDFIRYSKSQADYNPDTRHCLYGLDADLIMLGLVSHEPRFSLLREEVRFGGHKDKSKKRPMTPEETTFHLLHLSLLRDYLGYEFSDLKGKLSFEWDMERIIDDWILMGFLVGNDFIPHLPHLHIHHDALPMLWATYKSVLPSLDGYLNEGGHLNLFRFEKFMVELSKFDLETFESAFSDLRYLESKLGGKSINESAGAAGRGRKPKMKELKPFKVKENGNPFAALEDLSPSGALGSLVQDSGNEDDEDDDDDMSDDEEEDDDDDDDDDDDEDCDTFDDEFRLHKRDYYMSKMLYASVTPDVIKEQAQGYVTAIQWILLYYFEGCPSWSWFFAHHYAPYISDIRGFSDMKITFDLSTPFLPFQQLMAVLPAASKELLPPALQPLMTEESSPVLDFYPVNFNTDLNGKQQDWEAVVLIPFIEELRLLEAMASREHMLTKEERSRNSHGPHLLYQWSADNQGFYPSCMPGVFPDIHLSKAQLTEIEKHTFHIDANRLRKGLLKETRLDVYFPGFPTLRFLPHTFGLARTAVKVFQHNSRGENMVLRIKAKEGLSLEEVADELLGKETFVGWPHLHEARVTAVADNTYKIELIEDTGKKGKKDATLSFGRHKLDAFDASTVIREAESIKEKLRNRFAIEPGKTEIVVYASPMTGRTYTYGQHGAISLNKQFASNLTPYLYQMTVKDLDVEEASVTTLKTLEEVFPVGSSAFMLGNPHYGAQGKVKEVLHDLARIRIVLDVTEEPNFTQMARKGDKDAYMSNIVAAQQIGMDPYLMSRITGAIFVEKVAREVEGQQTQGQGQGHGQGQGKKVNIGLNLKFTKKNEEVLGYTKKMERGWCFSWKCVRQVEDYLNKFRDLWAKVRTLKDDKDIFLEEKLFPEGSSQTLSDVEEYLNKLPCSKAPKVPCGSLILDEDKVKEIESMTYYYFNLFQAILNPVADMVKMKVKPRLLFRPQENQGMLVPDPDADFQLYDRVVVVKAGYSVPYGQRGTVIGIPSPEDGKQGPQSLYDVVFDKPFSGGITLRCSPNRGYRVPGSAMLNLTFGEFRKEIAGPSGSGLSMSTPASTYNNNNSLAAAARGGKPGILGAAPNHSGGGAWQPSQSQQPHHHLQRQPVQWDSKGRPMFGKVFGMQGTPASGHQYVTPKVQGQVVMPTPRKVSQDTPKKVDNSEFDNMWKNLESHQSSRPGSGKSIVKGGGGGGGILSQGASASTTSASSPQGSPRSNLVVAHPPDNQASTRLLHHPVPQRISHSQMQSGITSVAAPASDAGAPSVLTLLQRQPKTGQSSHGANGSSSEIPTAVQNLFANASKMRVSQQSSPKAAEGSAIDGLKSSSSLASSALLSSASANPENSEFLALFNSLKTQTQEGVKQSKESSKSGSDVAKVATTDTGNTSSAPRSQSQADLALRQLLKIGLPGNQEPTVVSVVSQPSPVPTNTATSGGQVSPRPPQPPTMTTTLSSSATSDQTPSAASAYGRQVSLQELFEGAKGHQKQQHPLNVETSAPSQALPRSGQSPRSAESRDLIAEVENYCQANFNKSDIHFDFKHQPKQNAYIATVTLPNGHRYEGSLCQTRQEAAKSAASMALLCLKTSQTSTSSHPVIMGYMSGTGLRGPVGLNRFFSPNSAFSPIGMPGQASPATMTAGGANPAAGRMPLPHPRHQHQLPPMLLTPQHFINQPPPSLPGIPLHQLLQQQQQQQQQQRSAAMPHGLQQTLAHPPHQSHPAPPQQANNAFTPPKSHPAALSVSPQLASNTSAGATTPQAGSTSSQQFVPLQVTKKQKKREAEPTEVSPSVHLEANNTVIDSESRSAASHLLSDRVMGTGIDAEREKENNGVAMVSASGMDSRAGNVAVSSRLEPDLSGEDIGVTGSSRREIVTEPLHNASAIGDASASKVAGEPEPMSAASSKASEPSVKQGPKKRSRLAANFGQKK